MDYYPFGSKMEDRSWQAPNFSYRHGFNGMEQDNEVKGDGNSLDFGARIYDSRLGRWMSVDPLMSKYPRFSPYNFAINSPIIIIDTDGRDIYIVNKDNSVVKVTKEALENPSANNIDSEVAQTMLKAMNTDIGANVFNTYLNNSETDVYYGVSPTDPDLFGSKLSVEGNYGLHGKTSKAGNDNGKITVTSGSKAMNDIFNGTTVQNPSREIFVIGIADESITDDNTYFHEIALHVYLAQSNSFSLIGEITTAVRDNSSLYGGYFDIFTKIAGAKPGDAEKFEHAAGELGSKTGGDYAAAISALGEIAKIADENGDCSLYDKISELQSNLSDVSIPEYNKQAEE